MNNFSTSICTRCGKQRIISRTWKEEMETITGTTTVEYSETICPDPECQKIVEKQLSEQKEKNDQRKAKKERS
jgi:hypothetical protein